MLLEVSYKGLGRVGFGYCHGTGLQSGTRDRDMPLRARQAWDQGLAEALSPLALNLPPLDSVVPAGDAANAGAIAMALPPRQKFRCAARRPRARAPRSRLARRALHGAPVLGGGAVRPR